MHHTLMADRAYVMRRYRSPMFSSLRLLSAAAVLGFLVILTATVAAQEVPRFQVFGGYSYTNFDSKSLGFADSTGLNGGKIGVTYNLLPNFGVVGEVAGGWGTNVKFYDALVGPQVSYTRWKSTLFGQLLFGKAKTHLDVNGGTTDSGRSIAVAGGVDHQLGDRFSWRIVQAEYVTSHAFGQDQGNFQISTGLVFNFGHVKTHKPQKMPAP